MTAKRMPAIEKMSNNSNQGDELLWFFRIIIHFLKQQRVLVRANALARYFLKMFFMQNILGQNINCFLYTCKSCMTILLVKREIFPVFMK